MAEPRVTAGQIHRILRELGDAAIAEHAQRFFKTGKGEYGYGDRFLGVRVPVLRKLVAAHKRMALPETLKSLRSPFHEERMFAVLMLVEKFRQGGAAERETVYGHYLGHTRFINNWDLVDCSAHHVAGAYLEDKSRAPLHALARSADLWERRIAIIATFRFIRNRDFEDALRISAALLGDPEDLIHKAAGWMLREIGNRDMEVERAFLRKHCATMPRTMLRYAIEKFPEAERKACLRGTF